jgi:hypothetical protein
MGDHMFYNLFLILGEFINFEFYKNYIKYLVKKRSNFIVFVSIKFSSESDKKGEKRFHMFYSIFTLLDRFVKISNFIKYLGKKELIL